MAGAVAVDVGGGTTGVAVFSEGRPRRLSVIPVGGDHLTNDVACVLRIPLSKAEEIKREISLFGDPESQDETIDFEIRGRNYSCPVRDVADIVKCRIEELYGVLVKSEVAEAGLPMLPAGLVLTGGVAKTNDLDGFVSEVLDMPARAAFPLDSGRMPPGRNGFEYACAAGIIRYMLERERNPFRYMEPSLDQIKRQGPTLRGGDERPKQVPKKPAGPSGLEQMLDTLKKSFRELF